MSSDQSPLALEIEGLRLSIGGQPVLEDVDLRLATGEFLGIIGRRNPQPALAEIVNTTRDPVLATEALNSVVFFRDFFGDRCAVERSDFHPVCTGGDVDDRLNYINGEPYPPKAKKRKKGRKKTSR